MAKRKTEKKGMKVDREWPDFTIHDITISAFAGVGNENSPVVYESKK